MALRFTDADFQEAWKELDEPQLQGEWELFTESMGVKIYRLYNKETGLYEYKVFGTLSSCSPELCADVYMDLAYRKQWDSYVKALGEKPFRYLEVLVFIDWKRLPEGSFWKKSPGLIPENSQSVAQCYLMGKRNRDPARVPIVLELHEKDYDGQKAIYWEVKYPFPLSNRDYVYVRERRDLQVNGRKIWVVLARSSAVSHCPEKSGIIRVKDYKQTVAMETDGAQGTKIFMNYFDNPGGNIPAWLINWAAKSGVPGFLKDMQDACTKYATYCKNRK